MTPTQKLKARIEVLEKRLARYRKVQDRRWALQSCIWELEAKIAALEAADKAPEGKVAEHVAEWLRARGYTVTKDT